ncbi:hypothetical protein K435DRAFT_776965 [Dendrothele bispora CBS 962.96]|uniref:Uncharacterized protein n=1 Tax=Dendrothele bispora (strain CBS 962.96) TaxID=1314807 RepID=A0A4S8MAY8_DENBC|nr:hypothetical protein K435DRAFT_776965 [Dendrothele bispora CBS 962.96]
MAGWEGPWEFRSIPPPDYQDTIKPNAPPSMRNRFASSDLFFPEAPRSTLSTPTPAPARNDDESQPSSSGVQLAAPSPARPIVFEGFTPKPIPSWPQQPVPTARNPTPRTQMLSANGQWHQAQNPPYRPSPLSRTSVVPEDLDVDTPNTLVQPSSRPSTAVATPPNSAYSSPVKPINHPVSHVSPPPPPPIYRGDIPTARNLAFPGGDVSSSLQHYPHATTTTTTTITHPHAIPSSQLIPNPAAVAPVPHGYHSLPNRPVMHHPHLPPNAGSICENPIDVDELYIPDPRGCVSPPLSACASPEPVPGIVPLDPAEAAIFSFLDDYPLYADVSPPLSAVGSPELEASVTKGKGKGKGRGKEKTTTTTTAATASTTKAKKATTTTRKKRVSEPANDTKKAKRPNLKRGNDALEADDGSVTGTTTASRKRAKRG